MGKISWYVLAVLAGAAVAALLILTDTVSFDSDTNQAPAGDVAYARPAIDQQQPDAFETATFGMG